MKTRTIVGLLSVCVMLLVVAVAWAGMPEVYGEQMLKNILIGEGFSESEISKVLSLPRLPDVDAEHKVMKPGKQLWLNDEMSIAIVFDVKDGCCTVSHQLFDHTGR